MIEMKFFGWKSCKWLFEQKLEVFSLKRRQLWMMIKKQSAIDDDERDT